MPLFESYQPKISRGDPRDHFEHSFSSYLDVMTLVSVRIPKVSSTSIRHGTKKDGLYSIRKYSMQIKGESAHPIEDIMRMCRSCNSDAMRHLLMPIQSFLHVHDVDGERKPKPSFYTVSEHAFMTLGTMIGGLNKKSGYVLCHDDIWSIFKQVLSGLEFLATRGLQHDRLNLDNILITQEGIVKLGGIHHIKNEDVRGWDVMPKALEELVENLTQDRPGSCPRCATGRCSTCHSYFPESCCDSAFMAAQWKSISAIMRGSTCQTTAFFAIKNIAFINQAQEWRLRAAVDFTSGTIWRDLKADLRISDLLEEETSSICTAAE